MFDRFVDTRTSQKQPWKAAFLSISVAGHIGAAIALLIAGMWQLDRLSPPDRGVADVTFRAPRPPPPPAPSAKPKVKTAKKRVITKALRQPDNRVAPRPDEAELAMPEGEEGGTADGVENGIRGGDGDCDNCVPGLGIASLPPELTEIEPPEVEEKPKFVRQEVLQGRRVSGTEQIHPSDSVRMQIYRDGQDRLLGIFKMCIDKTGRISSVKVLKSIGYPAYDDELIGAMKKWRYLPYRAGKEPVPVCTKIDFVYQTR